MRRRSGREGRDRKSQNPLGVQKICVRATGEKKKKSPHPRTESKGKAI